MSKTTTDLLYLVTIVAFILALRFLSHPATARRGNWIGAVGMLVAVVVTFVQNQIVSYWEIAVGMVVGGVFGAVAARRARRSRARAIPAAAPRSRPSGPDTRSAGR